MNKRFIYCIDPECKTLITPQNALYKPENSSENVLIHSPKTFSKCSRRHFIYKYKGVFGSTKSKVNADTVYCPKCQMPVKVGEEPLRVSIIGPSSCGKTVFLTALNYMFTSKDFDKSPMNFVRTGGKNSDFCFRTFREDDTKKKNTKKKNAKVIIRSYLPDATNTGTFGYMFYKGASKKQNASFSEIKKHAKSIKNVQLAFYDYSGEYFQKGTAESDKDYYERTSQLYISDLILVVIDCPTIIGTKSRDNFSFSNFLEQYLLPIKKRNKKKFSVAICYLQSDTLDKDTYSNIRFDAVMYNEKGFDREKCRDHIDKVYAKLVDNTDEDAIAGVIKKCKLKANDTLGLFAISSIGDNIDNNKEDDNGKDNKNEEDDGPFKKDEKGEYYIENYDPEKSWNVLAPILWFLNQRGDIPSVKVDEE